MLSRRAFLRACMYVAPAALIVPEVARTFILAPADGWRPLTLEEIITRAFRARADRIAGNIANSSPLLRQLLRNRARELVEISRGHMLDAARDETAIARYLVSGTSLSTEGLVLRAPNPYTGMADLPASCGIIECLPTAGTNSTRGKMANADLRVALPRLRF